MIDVVVDELWNKTVAKTPIIRPTGWLDKKVDWEKKLLPSLPSNIKDADVRKLSEHMKK